MKTDDSGNQWIMIEENGKNLLFRSMHLHNGEADIVGTIGHALAVFPGKAIFLW